MENREFLKYLPSWLRSVPNLGAFVAGSLTVLAWLIPFLASKLFDLQGERGFVLIIFLPLLLPGLMTAEIIGKTTGLNLSGHPIAAGVLAVVLTVSVNMLAVWLILSFLTATLHLLRKKRRL